MDSTFLLKVLISALAGGTWVVLATVLADKFGTKVGGIVSGLPSTILFILLFVAWTQGANASVTATTIIPAVMGFNALFMLTYAYFIKKTSFWLSLTSATAIWAVFSLLLVIIHFNNFAISLVLYVLLLGISFFLIQNRLKVSSEGARNVEYTPSVLAFRGLISGFIIAFAVFLSKIGGPAFGGMFSAFPAATVSTFLITYFAHGAKFSAGIAKSAMLGAIGVVLYAILIRFTYNSIGVIPGTIIATLGSFFVGYLIYRFVLSKLN